MNFEAAMTAQLSQKDLKNWFEKWQEWWISELEGGRWINGNVLSAVNEKNTQSIFDHLLYMTSFYVYSNVL